MRMQHVMIGALACFVVLAAAGSARSQPGRVAASSEWGAGYGAAAAFDGVADENMNYWQTVQDKDKGAWWQQDLGRAVPVQGVKIVWARYEDKVHCPPAGLVIQVSQTGAEGSWQEARKVGAAELPRDQQPYDANREWSYPLSPPATARYVRLSFPKGCQKGAKYPGYLCLGEVEVQAPGIAPRLVTIEGRFGKVEVDVNSPSLKRLYLAGPGGTGDQSILATGGPRPWARGGCTYVLGKDGKRYESRLSAPASVDVTEQSGRKVLKLGGVRLATGADDEPVAIEDWSLSAPGEGSELVWQITRRWQKDLDATLSGSPALFFGFNARAFKNSVTTTIWYDPIRMTAGPSAVYALARNPRRISENHLQTIRDRDTWAIYKLWTNWHAPADLRLEVQGGHLYRRGSYGRLSEAGAVTDDALAQSHKKGQVEQITLKLAAVPKQTTGYQLAITLPDKDTEASLKDFYGSVLNGGAVNDQKGFDFGNETDGWYYAGSCWMYGMALSAGTPAPGPLSSHPYDAARAFREHLLHVVSLLDEKGRAHFGYNQGGQWVDDNLHTIIGTRAYLLHSGDLAFVRQILPAMETMLGYFIQRRGERGLFKLDDVGAHWYYDAVTTSGTNAYYNAFFYKAACDLAEMEAAAGRAEKAQEYRALADSLKKAFNEVFWREDLPGGPRYIDWIDSQGKEVAYFCDLCQWPPVAVGLASPEQARKIVATADARIKELHKEYGYQGYAGLSALWPVPKYVNPVRWQTYGVYMNGGSLLCQTYWEIVGRARAGDAEGAARRLKGFAARARQISWAGDNAANIAGEMKNGDGEPYLADMVAATAGAIHGVMGITPTWDRLEVKPCLPADWPRAEADFVYKGRRYHVTIEAGKVQVQPLEQLIDLGLLWNMDANFRTAPTGPAVLADVDLGDDSSVALAKAPGKPDEPPRYAKAGTYQSPPWNWAVAAKPTTIWIAANLSGGTAAATVETSNDGFKTVLERAPIRIEDGLNSYPLGSLKKSAASVRVRLELAPGGQPATTPVIDAFRIIAQPAD